MNGWEREFRLGARRMDGLRQAVCTLVGHRWSVNKPKTQRVCERCWLIQRPSVTSPDLTDDGMGNTCSHTSATGVDTTSWTDPNKVWRCDHCGLRWVQGPDGTRVTPPAMPLSASDSTPGAERPP